MHPTRNLFKEFPNRVYVETGAWLGDSIQLALDAGFEEIRSIEQGCGLVNHCRQRFKGHPVTMYEGDSATTLWAAIQDIEEPITFWLDSHSQLLEDELEVGTPFPLIAELRQIAMHPIKTHTIMIDDFLFMSHPDITGWRKWDIFHELFEINREYKREYFANPITNNILVAHV
jgi:hypothetical protein